MLNPEKPFLFVAALVMLTLIAAMQQGCFFGEFNNTETFGSTNKLSSDTPAVSTCTATVAHGAPDECFGNDASTKGVYRLANESDAFQAAHTDTALPIGAAPTHPVTTTDADGNFYAIYPVLKDGLAAARLIQLKANQTSATLPGAGFVLTPITTAEGFGGSAHLTVTAMKVTEGASSGIRYIYYAGTYYNQSSLENEFFICRLISDESSQENTPVKDTTFSMGTGCARFSSSSMAADLGAATYIPRAASSNPVHIAFHRGSDSVDRVVLAGVAWRSSDATHHVVVIPLRLDGTGISGPGGTSLAKVTSHNLQTAGVASTFTMSGGAVQFRSLRIAALEADTALTSPDNLFMLLAFGNTDYTVGTGPGTTTPVEHVIFRLSSTLALDTSFGTPYVKPAVYIPATLDNSGIFSSTANPGVKAINSQPWLNTSSTLDMKVHDGKIVVLGLHIDAATTEPTAMGYRLLRFSTTTSINPPDQQSHTVANTFCSPTASPKLHLKQNSGDVLIACSQKTNNNSVMREHDGANLSIIQMMGSAGSNFATFMENTHVDLQGKFSTGITSVWVPAKSMHAVYTFFLEKSGTGHYPSILKTWSQ